MMLFESDVCISSFTQIWGSWQGTCFLAIAVSAVILAFLYMLGKAFRHPHLEAWVKDEFGQLFATTIIAVMIVSLVGFMCSFSPSFLDPTNSVFVDFNTGRHLTNTFDVADNYLREVRDRAVIAIGLAYAMNAFVDFMQAPTYEATPTGIGITTQSLAGFAPILNALSTMMSALTVALITVASQIEILNYVWIAVPGYLIPLGIFFRCFEPTRLLGGSLLALAIGLFLFYPFILTFDDLIIHDSLEKAKEESVSSVNTFSNPGGADSNAIISGGEVETPAAVARLMGKTIVDMFKAAFTFNSDRGGASGILENIFTPVLGPIIVLVNFTFQLLIATVVLGVLNFVILITAIRGFSRLLGEEVDVTNITRMV